MTHDLRHQGILFQTSSQWRPCATCTQLTNFEVAQATSLATSHPLEISAAQPQIPQAKLLRPLLQFINDRRDDFPSLFWVFRYLILIQLLIGQYIFL